MRRPLDPLVVHLGRARIAQRLSQSAVAVRMYLAPASSNRVSVLELGGRSPTLGTLRRWTRALGFDLALVPYRPEAPDATAALMEQLEQLLAELDRLRIAHCAGCKGDE
jgi:transcriptional regulator with XRE-family HTH domain